MQRFAPRLTFLSLLAACLCAGAGAQTPAPVAAPTAATAPSPTPDYPIDAATQASVVGELARQLNARYVFPDVAARVGAELQTREQRGDYRSLASSRAFAQRLTEDLRTLSHDLHLTVTVDDGRPRGPRPAPKSTDVGIERVARLEGNVAYLDLRGFYPVDRVRAAAIEAMGQVADAAALIVDLRHNGGGDPQTVALFSSYLFDGRVHLNDLYWREGDQTQSFWTSADVAGPRFGARKPVYVLTSGATFSAAEEFTYNLQALKRATVVGETTRGGANPGGDVKIGEHLHCFIPTGRAINPITKTNWEGTGVKPDVAVPAAQALDRALALARAAAKGQSAGGG